MWNMYNRVCDLPVSSEASPYLILFLRNEFNSETTKLETSLILTFINLLKYPQLTTV